MDSTSEEHYDKMVNELEEKLDIILKINQHKIINALLANVQSEYSQFMGYLELPPNIKECWGVHLYNYSNLESKKVWIIWNHYILKEFTIEELRNKLINIISLQLGYKLRPIQRGWKERFYSPDGIFMKKHGREIAERWGMQY